VIEWLPPKDTAIVSQCGRYSVAKIGPLSSRPTYEAWRTLKHPLGRLQLATNLSDAMTAKLRCEADERLT